MIRFIPCLLGAAMLTGCGPEGHCEGFVGGTRIEGNLDGDSTLLIVPMTFSPSNQGAYVRGAQLQLFYGDSKLRVLAEVRLPAEQDLTDIPLGLSQEEWTQRLPQEGAVSIFALQAPENAPRVSGGTFSVRLADPHNLEGKFDARFEDGSRLECTYDLRGKNYVPGDDPTYNGPP
jgi:hypothetical protein